MLVIAVESAPILFFLVNGSVQNDTESHVCFTGLIKENIYRKLLSLVVKTRVSNVDVPINQGCLPHSLAAILWATSGRSCGTRGFEGRDAATGRRLLHKTPDINRGVFHRSVMDDPRELC